jgi:hypothetical protein
VRRILGPGPIDFWQDKAPGHRAKKTQALLEMLFDEVVNQPGKSPDTSILDKGVFPWMDRRTRLHLEGRHPQGRAIRVALAHAGDVRVVADRVRRNIVSIIRIEGGNFYDEGGDPSCAHANKRARRLG